MMLDELLFLQTLSVMFAMPKLSFYLKRSHIYADIVGLTGLKDFYEFSTSRIILVSFES